jgi:uncharacterized membrane protein
MQETILSTSYFVHLLATVTWIGGLLILTLFVWPLAHRFIRNPDESRQFVLGLQRRFRPMANLSLVFLLGTGMIQTGADPNYEGLLTFDNGWTIAMLFKHLAYVGMVALVGIVQFGIVPAIERATLLAARDQPNDLAQLIKREANLTRGLLGLGIIVLLFTAIATAI